MRSIRPLALLLAATIAVVVTQLSACSRPDDGAWPPQVINNFSTACVDNATKTGAPPDVAASRCDCILKRLQSKFTIQQFTELEGRAKTSGKMPPEVTSELDLCMK